MWVDLKEAGVYAEALKEEHGCSVVGVTETHCKMEGKVRTRYPQLGAPRPGPHGDKGHGGVALIFSAGVEFKRAEKNFQIIVGPRG